jgi:type IV pilus assembly protein PilY1
MKKQNAMKMIYFSIKCEVSAMKKMNKNIRSTGIVVLVLLLSLMLPALSQGADVMNDYCSTPPFIVGGVTPNLMLMIDNSASMFDITYVDRGGIVCSGNNAQYCDSDSECAATGSGTCDVELRRGNYCYDQTYQFGEHYEGYFKDWFIFYEYDFVNEHFNEVPALPGACDKHVAGTLCIDIGWDAFGERTVIRFVAEGNYLNWLTASKFDVQKKILTGGKYQAPFLIQETRGCVGRKFIKEALAQQSFIEGGPNTALGITFGVRGPKHPYSETSLTLGGTTEIDIFEGDYDEQLCGDAINSILDDDNKQTIQSNIEACLVYSGGKHCSLDDSIPCNTDADCAGEAGVCDIFNDGVCDIFNDGVCTLYNDGVCDAINDGVCDIVNDGVCGIVNDGVCTLFNDGVCGIFNDGVCTVYNDGVCNILNDGVCQVVNNGTCAVTTAGVCTDNNGTCSAGRVCIGGVDDGNACNNNGQCDSGLCSKLCIGGGKAGAVCNNDNDCLYSSCTAGKIGNLCSVNADCDLETCTNPGSTFGDTCVVNADCNSAECTAGEPIKIGTPCASNDQCDTPSTCSAGQVGNPCVADADCDTPNECTAGDAGKLGNPCVVNADCDTPNSCTAGQVGNPCVADADCDTPGGSCTAGQIGNPCAVDTDCNTGAGSCTAPPINLGNVCLLDTDCNTAAGSCTAGQIGNICLVDTDCNTPGNECTAGQIGNPCLADADCDTPNECTAGDAGKIGNPCVADADCNTPDTCSAGQIGNPCTADADCNTPNTCSAPAVNIGKPCAIDGDCSTFYGFCQQPVTQQIKSTFTQSVHECYQYWQTGGFVGTDYLNIIANPAGCNQIYKEYKLCNGGARDGEICEVDADCIGGGTCVHGPDHIRPGSAALVCSDTYTGYCATSPDNWDTTNWVPREYADADACITAKFAEFCVGVEQPPVVDPTDDPSNTEEYDNLPAIIADLGIENQLGPPIGTVIVKLNVAQEPTGLIQEFEELIHFGAMTFNYYGASTECPGDIPCTKVCQVAGTICTSDIECPGADTCVVAANLDGGQITGNGYIMGHCSATVATTCNKNTHCPAGEVCIYDVGDHTSGLINDIDDIFASTWTPFAEGFYNTIGYFAQRADKRLNATDFILEAEDPDYRDPVQYSCQKNNVLLISDGMSTADLNVDVNNVVFVYNDGDGEIDNVAAAVCPKFAGSRNVDDLAWLAKNRNIEDFTQAPDPDSENSQTLTTHAVFNGVATADPGECNPDLLMNQTADNGGGTYQRAENPAELKDALREAFQMIAGRAASGTAASVLASGEGTGANLIQAIFYPERTFFGGDEILWTGSLKNLWYHIDPSLGHSSIREDRDIPPKDFELRLNSDRIIHFFFDTTENLTKANLFTDSDADGAADNPAAPDETVFFENVSSLWEAGLLLWNRTAGEENLAGDRLIYTTLDNGSTRTDFTKSNAAALRDFLQAATDQEAERLILWTRGYDKFCSVTIDQICNVDANCPGGETCETPLRNRTVMYDINADGDVNDLVDGMFDEDVPKVWKLGDIVNATPRIMSWVPMNIYFRTYDDYTYDKFTELPKYTNRGLVLSGANDGMLHGFNLGTLEIFFERYKKAALSGGSIGEEAWAFIPQNVLPYLKYIADPGYCHVYTVDLTPYVFDANIGNGGANYWNNNKDENSWRTIVIGGMRIGGACKDVCGSANCVETPTAGKGYSSYFALDITDKNDPNYPEVLWEFSSEDLGFATSGPAIVKISALDGFGNPDHTKNGRFFVVFGSGPTGPIDTNKHQFKGFSDQELRFFVLDLADGTLLRTINSGISNAFAGSLIESTIDFDQEDQASEGYYQDDALYFGFVKAEHDPPGVATAWNQGGVLRLVTNNDLDPNNWELTTFFEGGPVTSGVSKLQNYGSDKFFLFWGEGRYFYKIADVIDDATSLRRIYGVKEPCFGVGGFDTAPGGCLDTPGDRKVDLVDLYPATIGADPADPRTLNGWYIDLDDCTDIFGNAIACGDPAAQFMTERVVTDTLATPIGAVFFTTTKPSADVCEFGGTSHLWAVDYDTGGAVSASVLRGKAVMQVSTASIEEIDLKTAFDEKTDASTGRGRRTSAFQGVPPAGSPPGILVPADPINKFIHIFEK